MANRRLHEYQRLNTRICRVLRVVLHLQVGFADPRVLEVEPIAVHDTGLKALLGDAAFYSITFRCVYSLTCRCFRSITLCYVHSIAWETRHPTASHSGVVASE
jgi:hypothetical protein